MRFMGFATIIGVLALRPASAQSDAGKTLVENRPPPSTAGLPCMI